MTSHEKKHYLKKKFHRYAFTVYVTVLSVVLLVVVALDRYLSICHPIKYGEIMRGRIAK